MWMAVKREGNIPPLIAVGQLIHEAREKRGMTILGLSEKTNIDARWIVAIEAGQFDRIPGRTYVLGFTRHICSTLGFDADALVQVVNSELYPGTDVALEAGIAADKRQGLLAKAIATIKSFF